MPRVMLLLVLVSSLITTTGQTAEPESTQFRLPRIFGDNMVLQQNARNAIWGFSAPAETVTVRTSWGAEVSATADSQGDWKVMLETPEPGTGHSITISGKDTIEIRNVAIGEVWLCAGQSNMGWSLGNCFGGEEEAAQANFPDYRIFRSARQHWHEPLKESRDRLAQWSPCTPESAAATSAVSYYFGKKLHEELGIPVGIIVQAYAGTPIEGWMPKEIQAEDPRTIEGMQNYQRLSQRFSTEEALETFYDELKLYHAKVDAGETMKNAFRPLAPPIITKPAILGHQYPSHIFNAMICPIRPYGIRGAIWYQGERNSKDVPQALNYRKQLALLIDYYRCSWHELSQGNVSRHFPFYFTQLPSWNPPQQAPVEGLEAPWAVNREMMRLVAQDVANTGMAVAIDTGDAIALHPKNKRPVGLRLAYLALKDAYGKDFVACGPRFVKQTVQANQIILEFDSVGSGLIPAEPGKLNSFAIAGNDRVWHWADATIAGDTLIVTSPDVGEPVAVRYAWAMNPSQRNLLYNQEGLPASPFRTDDWPLFDPEKDEPILVNKPQKPDGYEPKDWKRPAMTP